MVLTGSLKMSDLAPKEAIEFYYACDSLTGWKQARIDRDCGDKGLQLQEPLPPTGQLAPSKGVRVEYEDGVDRVAEEVCPTPDRVLLCMGLFNRVETSSY